MKLKANLRKAATVLSVFAVVLSTGAVAFAADAEADTFSYRYHAGEWKNGDRHTRYAELSGMTDEERQAFFAENGIGGLRKGGRKLDTEDLLAAGVID